MATTFGGMSPLANNITRGRSRDFQNDGELYVGHHGWLTKKLLAFRFSKKTKITLEAIRFWRNISISIFKLLVDGILSIFQNLQTL